MLLLVLLGCGAVRRVDVVDFGCLVLLLKVVVFWLFEFVPIEEALASLVRTPVM